MKIQFSQRELRKSLKKPKSTVRKNFEQKIYFSAEVGFFFFIFRQKNAKV